MSRSDSQIARQILEADFANINLDTSTLVDTLTKPESKIYTRLPLSNRPCLELMKELDKCKDPGTIIYLEFDLNDSSEQKINKLKAVDRDFLNGCFNFRLNVMFGNTIGDAEWREVV